MGDYVISLYRDIPVIVYEGLLLAFLLGTIAFIAYDGVKCGWRKIVGLILVEYVILIYCSTVIFRSSSEATGYEYIPLWSYMAIQEGKVELLSENILNIAVFVPMGIMLGMVFRTIRWWQVLMVGCLMSVSIEAIQLMFKRGFSETDDVLHNTVGCMIGFGITSIIGKMIIKR
jgi:glycopeptide antibiotics resistance protein